MCLKAAKLRCDWHMNQRNAGVDSFRGMKYKCLNIKRSYKKHEWFVMCKRLRSGWQKTLNERSGWSKLLSKSPKMVTNALVFSGFILNEVQVSWLESWVSKYISHNMFQWNLDHLLQMSFRPIRAAIFHRGFCVTFTKRFIRPVFPWQKWVWGLTSFHYSTLGPDTTSVAQL